MLQDETLELLDELMTPIVRGIATTVGALQMYVERGESDQELTGRALNAIALADESEHPLIAAGAIMLLARTMSHIPAEKLMEILDQH